MNHTSIICIHRNDFTVDIDNALYIAGYNILDENKDYIALGLTYTPVYPEDNNESNPPQEDKHD